MVETTVLGGFPLHFFLAAIVTPLGALLLSVAYATQRDRLDTKYGISHEADTDSSGAVATDGVTTDARDDSRALPEYSSRSFSRRRHSTWASSSSFRR